MIGCDCAVCRSADPRDNRLRSSITIETDDGHRVLVDTGTDLRQQALRANLRRLDAVLYTHAHADHLFGLDEIRRFNGLQKMSMPLFATPETLAEITRTFAYVFHPDAPRGGGVPHLDPWPIRGPFCLFGLEVVPVPVRHGPWEVTAYRIGSFAYVTDCNGIPDASLELLAGVKVLVLDALRPRPHPTHFSLEQAIQMARRLGAAETYFTHISHEMGHEETTGRLPPGMNLAYDGLALDL
jgi:phosphoribosyl 1,2-cyclic phosphate phosphodiesterase